MLSSRIIKKFYPRLIKKLDHEPTQIFTSIKQAISLGYDEKSVLKSHKRAISLSKGERTQLIYESEEECLANHGSVQAEEIPGEEPCSYWRLWAGKVPIFETDPGYDAYTLYHPPIVGWQERLRT